MVLAGKVARLGANRGFLVARKITKDAEAELKLDTRLRFLQCTSDFLSPFKSIDLIHTQHDPLPIRIFIKQVGVPPVQNPEPLEWNTIRCTINGHQVDFLSFVKSSVDRLVQQDKKEHFAEYHYEGNHFRHCAEQAKFEPGECFINEIEVECLTVEFQCLVNIQRPKLLSKFELKDQGRIYSFEPVESIVLGKQIEIDLVHRI